MPSSLSRSSDAIFPDWSGKRQFIQGKLENISVREIGAFEAEEELRDKAPNSFLIRKSSKVGNYALTLVVEKKHLYHFRYVVAGPVIIGLGKPFRSLAGFISYAIQTTKEFT